MASLRSGIFFIHSSNFELCDPHLTRLSLNFNLDETQTYTIASRSHKVSPSRYLLIEEGQSFRTFADFKEPARMLTIAYQVGLVGKLSHSLSKTNDELLDDPSFGNHSNPYLFDQTRDLTPGLFNKVAWLCASRGMSCDGNELEMMLEDILEGILMEQLPFQKSIQAIDGVKLSTKRELFKRIHWALDYIHDNFTKQITIDQLASVACLSTFHFKRLFTQVLGAPPYQYIRNKRIEKAKELLLQGMSVSAVCRVVGWQNASSFTRLFKRSNACTPKQFTEGYTTPVSKEAGIRTVRNTKTD
jgi:AraC family transcriptional regulator